MSGKRRRTSVFKRKPKPLWFVITGEILMTVAALLVYALFHHVIPRSAVSIGITSNRYASTAVEEAEPTAEITESISEETEALPTATPAVDEVGSFAIKFADKFTSGDVIVKDNSYQSANMNITITPQSKDGKEWYVADIYIRDISVLHNIFAKDTFAKRVREYISDMVERTGAILAINGDYYGLRDDGIVIRDGELYMADAMPQRDVCVLYWDGSMKTYNAGKFNCYTEIENGAYQAWNFGPSLLDENGEAKTEFNSDVVRSNPRTVIGYYEPGHYCFVVADGRNGDSEGINLHNMSLIMQDLGCKAAYNLDGGKSSQMYFMGKVVNDPYEGGRDVSDAIALIEPQ